MDSKSNHGSFEYINLDGRNVGATMRLQPRGTKGEPKDDCCINIYVNNNVQGVSNSVLRDTEVRMKDSGISLYLENLKVVDRCTPTCNKRFCWGNRLGIWLCLLNLLALLFLLVLLFSTRIIIILVLHFSASSDTAAHPCSRHVAAYE
ncbi:hypothetical protein VNO77_17471 [Canavalia gladiata]|uniref:Uncharacterized protein n=1 Tax=Canavalia gladiata TaxID=3824 RepID=A0AAN9QMR1_CANGL